MIWIKIPNHDYLRCNDHTQSLFCIDPFDAQKLGIWIISRGSVCKVPQRCWYNQLSQTLEVLEGERMVLMGTFSPSLDIVRRITLVTPWLIMPSSSSNSLHPCRSLYIMTPLELFKKRCFLMSTGMFTNLSVRRRFSALLFLAHSTSRVSSWSVLMDRGSPAMPRMALEMAIGLRDVIWVLFSDSMVKKRDQLSDTGDGGWGLLRDSLSWS